jgi:hypothetical protein
MNLDDYLLHKNLSVPKILQAIRGSFELEPSDILFVSGSLVEGIGNEKSDIDLLLITSRTDLDYNACLNDISVIVADCLIDIRVVDHGELAALLDRFQAWGAQPRNPRRAFEFVEDERKLLYRTKIGVPLVGVSDLRTLQDRIPARLLALHKLDWARHLASTIQVDLAGFRNHDDGLSMLFAAQELLGHCMDALLAATGFVNPNTKWRTRYLSMLDDRFMSKLPGNNPYRNIVDLYLDYHRMPVETASQSAYEFALRIASFSRIAFPWAERTLLAAGDAPLSASLTCPPPSHGFRALLEHLDVDVEVRYEGGTFEMSRLNAAGPTVCLSDDAYRTVCLFDGKTRQDCVVSGSVVVEDIVNLVRFAKLQARPIVDEANLRKLLQAECVTS